VGPSARADVQPAEFDLHQLRGVDLDLSSFQIERSRMMNKKAIAVFLAMLPALVSMAHAQSAHLMVPQSLRYEHQAVIDRLTKEAARSGLAAAVAGRALVVVGAHFAKEEEFVFPPLGLLDQIAAGEMPSDDVKKAAIDMAERTNAATDDLKREHELLVTLMNQLVQAATQADEPALMTFASDLAAHALDEVEILEPATIMIGQYLQSK
jgi:hypothetical protein